mgnify:CR=1 FL=1
MIMLPSPEKGSLLGMALEVILGFDDDGLSVFIGNDDALAELCLALEELPLRLTDIFANALK